MQFSLSVSPKCAASVAVNTSPSPGMPTAADAVSFETLCPVTPLPENIPAGAAEDGHDAEPAASMLAGAFWRLAGALPPEPAQMAPGTEPTGARPMIGGAAGRGDAGTFFDGREGATVSHEPPVLSTTPSTRTGVPVAAANAAGKGPAMSRTITREPACKRDALADLTGYDVPFVGPNAPSPVLAAPACPGQPGPTVKIPGASSGVLNSLGINAPQPMPGLAWVIEPAPGPTAIAVQSGAIASMPADGGLAEPRAAADRSAGGESFAQPAKASVAGLHWSDFATPSGTRPGVDILWTVAPASEKNAAPAALDPESVPDMIFSGKRNFLNVGDKLVAGPHAGVGISGAKLGSNMSFAPSSRSKTAVVSQPSWAVPVALSAESPLHAEAPVPVANVRETIAAVVSAVETLEHRTSTASRSIDLQFHVGADKLGLRIELRDGTVHTTFLAATPELRNALMQEWHAVIPAAFGRELSVAPPVFNAAAVNGDETAFGALNQGNPQSRGHPEPKPALAPSARALTDAVATESVPVVSAAMPNAVSLLNAFA